MSSESIQRVFIPLFFVLLPYDMFGSENDPFRRDLKKKVYIFLHLSTLHSTRNSKELQDQFTEGRKFFYLKTPEHFDFHQHIYKYRSSR